MANLKEIRNRIRSVITTQQMTRAMKMVAAAKLRKAQDKIMKLRPYAVKMKEIIANLNENQSGEVGSPYAEVRDPKKVLLIVVTSNRGLCGAFNANVVKLAQKAIEDKYRTQLNSGNLELLCIGKKGYEFFFRRKYKLVGQNHDIFSNLSFESANEICDIVMKGFTGKKWDVVDIIYNEFRNVISQNKIWERFLPITPAEITPSTGPKKDYIFEPGQKEILETLIPKSLRLQFFKAVIESNAGEQGARMSAMDNATTNADELLKELRLNYNRARQATITKEILEIVAGADALGG